VARTPSTEESAVAKRPSSNKFLWSIREELFADGFEDELIAAYAPRGQAVCWGGGPAVDNVDDGVFVAIDAGSHQTCGVTAEGEVRCWGLDSETGKFFHESVKRGRDAQSLRMP
jgi:hypothetical protein